MGDFTGNAADRVVDAKPPDRHGKIERYIITWPLRFGERYNYFVLSKSGVILSYYRHMLGFQANPTPAVVKEHMDEVLYNRLHCSFTRSLKSLERKELILKLKRPKASRAHRPYNHIDEHGFWRGLQRKAGRREAFYQLTEAGMKLGRKWLKQFKQDGRMDLY